MKFSNILPQLPQTCGAFKELEVVHDYLNGVDSSYKMFLYLKHQLLLDRVNKEFDYDSLIEYLQEIQQDNPGYDWGEKLQSIDDIIIDMNQNELEGMYDYNPITGTSHVYGND